MPADSEQLFSQRNLQATRDLIEGLGQRFQAWRNARVGLKGALLYVLPSPLALTAVIELAKGQWDVALASAGAFLAIVFGGRLNREAIREAILAPSTRYTLPPRVPLKWQAAALVSGGTSLAASAVVEHGLMASALFGLLALGGFHLAYGLAPARRQVQVNPAVAADTRLSQALARAERRILTIEAAAETIGNAELAERLMRIAGQARAVLDMIAQRPGELFRARKFLSVYLEGAQRVASRYVKTHRIARSQVLEQNFRNVLDDIETVFERQQVLLAEHDVEDLDIQIEVLRKRLQTEGMV